MITKEQLSHALTVRAENHFGWLGEMLEKQDPSCFPYTPDSKMPCSLVPVQGAVDRARCEGLIRRTNDEPAYLVNMPAVFSGDVKKGVQKCVQILEKLRDESFGENAGQSKELCEKKIAVVIGLNRMYSLDSEVNRKLEETLAAIPKIKRINVRILGFHWQPSWKVKAKTVGRVYDHHRAYQLMKCVAPELAAQWIRMTEHDKFKTNGLNDLIPYQRIRETIKNSEESHFMLAELKRGHRLSKIFYTTLDDDFQTLRGEKKGVFSLADEQVRRFSPTVLTFGYAAGPNEDLLTRLAVKVDMQIRGAMAAHVPRGPYYPEPLMMVAIHHAEDPLFRLSFLSKGEGLESRRLIESGVKKGVIDPERMRFVACEALRTSIPKRMVPSRAGELATVLQSTVGHRKYLQSLRGIAQTHHLPRKWAMSLYAALPIIRRVTDVTKPLMDMFQAFEPIELAFQLPAILGNNYSIRFFALALQLHPDYVSFLSDPVADQRKLEGLVSRMQLTSADAKQRCRAFFSQRHEMVKKAKATLAGYGLLDLWVKRSTAAAKASGEAVYRVLIELPR